MYQDEYKRWLAADLEDPDLKPELLKIADDDEAIKDRFAVSLAFGTAGLRGTLGAGTNRMNIWVVRQATQGVANWVKTQGGNQTVAISYDSRLKSDVFAKEAASVLAGNGINVRIYDALMPVPALSFATRYYECNAGIMITASHNPSKYNGFKAYGPDGCQMTDDAAAIVYDEIQKTDILTGIKKMSFATGVNQGIIKYVEDDCKEAFYEAIEARQVRPGLCKTAGLKLVYSPLNGTGLVPVTKVLGDMGITDITIVVGYKAGMFQYLQGKYGVDLVMNEDYDKYNNTSSVIRVLDRLADTYLCSSDNYFPRNVFLDEPGESCYSALYAEGPTGEYCMTADEEGTISSVTVGGHDSWYMVGHVYFNNLFSKRFAEILKKEYENPETRQGYWEDVYIRHIPELPMKINRYADGDILEFDTLDELRLFDGSYQSDTRSAILKTLCSERGWKEEDLHGFRKIKFDENSFQFSFLAGSDRYLFDSQSGLKLMKQ